MCLLPGDRRASDWAHGLQGSPIEAAEYRRLPNLAIGQLTTWQGPEVPPSRCSPAT
jgi:hypothetical protein